jgi:four helix bundle protein
MTKEELNERLIQFAVDVIKVAQSLPKSFAGNHLANQLIRSGTAPSLHYGEAQSAESRADFIHKMKIAAKELRETYNNFQIVKRLEWIKVETINKAINENNQLISIFTASVLSAQLKTNQKSKINNHQS